jgi:pyruvate dehydrogenase E1 component alpha subunit
MQHRKEIVTTVFGDGASNEGVFHEALNMAALWKLPNLYVCENNKYGMSMDIANAAAKLPIAQRAEGYGIPWSYIDGNDLLTVYETMRDAVTHIRSGLGPVLVEAQTYRYFGHSKSDRNLYRSKDEIDEWRSTKDPIQLFRSELEKIGLLNDTAIEEIEQEITKVIEAAVAFAEASPEPDPSTVMEFVYA